MRWLPLVVWCGCATVMPDPMSGDLRSDPRDTGVVKHELMLRALAEFQLDCRPVTISALADQVTAAVEGCGKRATYSWSDAQLRWNRLQLEAPAPP